MKPNLKKMLNDFIERDFSFDEMLDVLYTLHNVEEYRQMSEVYRKHGMIDDVFRMNNEEEGARYMAYKTLRKYDLEYEIDELL